jgi:RNA polymerase sigma factor (sigma-70 family)
MSRQNKTGTKNRNAYIYHDANGNIADVLVVGKDGVTEELIAELYELDRHEYNNGHKEKRRHVSLDAYNLDDNLIRSGTNLINEVETNETIDVLNRATARLSPGQRKLVISIYYEGERLTDIAKREGVSKSAITHRLERAMKKIKKYLE